MDELIKHDGMHGADSLSAGAMATILDGSHCAGYLVAVLRDKDGNVIDRQEVPNQFQTAGKTLVADALSDQGEAAVGWMAIGTGTGQGVGDNTLATELDRQALDGGTPTHAANVVTYHRAFAAGEGTGVVTEAGTFNATPAGDMMLYNGGITFDKGASSSLTLTWTFTVN